jgi:hypothetical protein
MGVVVGGEELVIGGDNDGDGYYGMETFPERKYNAQMWVGQCGFRFFEG